jgi:lipopolysaccharide transport system ATP-binding protein
MISGGRPMTNSVITVDNVSMGYRLYDRAMDIVKETILGGVRHDTFWALRDINLEVNEGERLGIVGPNGAGKSTLLKIICGNLTPTTGSVSVNGRISSLLSMTPAWNEEENGIENIKYNLMLQGMERARIPGIIDDIIDFTELGPFIYQPVKTYSTGMGARLSFAIATATDPDILIVDEVLGTGDGYFNVKASARMKEFCARGRALLFVSHSTHAVRSMCDRCIWVENGAVRLDGPSETVVQQYENDQIRKDEETNRAGNKARLAHLQHTVSPEDVTDEDSWAIRIRPKGGIRFTDTHYVRQIEASVDDVVAPVPLAALDMREMDVVASIDDRSSEWGRMFERRGEHTRTLAPRIGVRRGGRLLVKRTKGDGRQRIGLTFDYASLLGHEELCAEVLDVANAEWKRLQIASENRLPGGWTRVHAQAEIEIPDDEAFQRVRAISAKVHARPVEITGVSLISAGNAVVSVPEFAPLRVRVHLKRNEPVGDINVSLNLYRTDGVYVFYQASCLSGGAEFSGDWTSAFVDFDFGEVIFGAGSYEINAFASNTFTLETAPPSEIYDKILGVKMDIFSERPISFGLVTSSVPVSITRESSAAEAAQ